MQEVTVQIWQLCWGMFVILSDWAPGLHKQGSARFSIFKKLVEDLKSPMAQEKCFNLGNECQIIVEKASLGKEQA